MAAEDIGGRAELATGDTAGAIATELDMSVVYGVFDDAGRTMMAGCRDSWGLGWRMG